MTTIYMSQRDYRQDMRCPDSAARCHAVCRKLTGCASQDSHWYGAHYFAACAVLGAGRKLEERLALWRGAFLGEVKHSHDGELPAPYAALWDLAVARVTEIADEAYALPDSRMW